jgi:hypothetical protein
MKKNLLIVASFFSVGFSYGQVLDTVSMNGSYVNENYYTLDNDNEVSVIRNDWDL